MRRKIYRSMLLTVLLAALCIGLLLMLSLYQLFTGQLRNSLSSELKFMAAAVNQAREPQVLFEAFDGSSTRLTWIDADGNVRYDSDANASRMENHLDRPEIQEALKDGFGSSSRFSTTLGKETLYFAARLEDGGILRMSSAQTSVVGLILQMLQIFIMVALAVVILSMVLSHRITDSIIRPLNHLNLDDPVDNAVYEELTPLLSSLAAKNRQIARQMRELQKRQTEFAAITENMSEGLVLMNAQGGVLSMNRSAAHLFNAGDRAFSGEYVLSLCRNLDLSRAINAAIEGHANTQVMELNGRHYELIATPVRAGSDLTTGIVLLIPDITDRYDAEKTRREFTANVSHELKTPLTTILGYTELLLSGMAPAEESMNFAALIHTAAKQLLQLIEDTIHLSHLDESDGQKPEFESVSLLETARNVCQHLQLPADQKKVTLYVEGDNATVNGVPRMLEEAIYNLADNAIKYNKEGGSVTLCVEQTADGPLLRVIDTGIGIAPEHHEKIFERFYRVDKSHSRETGGTGLGLAIVKHVAQIHGARLKVISTPGKGTEIAMLFPSSVQRVS